MPTMNDIGPDPIDPATSGPIDADGPCDDCRKYQRGVMLGGVLIGLGAGILAGWSIMRTTRGA